MPKLSTARNIASMKYNGAKTPGQIQKENSDFTMEYTWDNDIQSRKCYIYDYWHDDSPTIKEHMTYENTTKTAIDAKFIISSYGSLDKDQVAYHLMFRPSQPVEFTERDELYYFEKNYRERFDVHFPIGLYVDIPNDRGVYVRWLICDFEEANQFVKYVVLPCDYRFQWISMENNKPIKHQVWGCTRSMNSYTAGLWIDRYFYSLDDVNKILLPLNSITSSFHYLKDNGENQRVIMSAKSEHPLTYKISKIENTKPIGILKVTLDQDTFNQNTDYIEKDSNGNIIGMWADYYNYKIDPVEPISPDIIEAVHCELIPSSNIINDGGSFRTIKASFYNSGREDITDEYSSISHVWEYFVDDEDVSDYITEKLQDDNNVIKIKLYTSERKYVNKLLTVKCTVEDIYGETQIEIGV